MFGIDHIFFKGGNVLYDVRRNSKFVFNAHSSQSQNQSRYESLGKVLNKCYLKAIK